jgi:hypothetical protein
MAKKRIVEIPVASYPELNFIGVLVGPRGSQMRRMEEESGSSFKIAGQGSNLYVEISGETSESVDLAASLVEQLIQNTIRFH